MVHPIIGQRNSGEVMRHFYRMMDQVNQTTTMVALMQRQSNFQSTSTEGLQEIKVPDPDFSTLTQLTLGMMEVCGTLNLVRASVLRCAPSVTVAMGVPGDFSRKTFAIVLHAGEGVLLNADDEGIYIRSREVWSINDIDVVHMINKSEDDVFVLWIDVGMP